MVDFIEDLEADPIGDDQKSDDDQIDGDVDEHPEKIV